MFSLIRWVSFASSTYYYYYDVNEPFWYTHHQTIFILFFKLETLEALQNRSFFWKMMCLSPLTLISMWKEDNFGLEVQCYRDHVKNLGTWHEHIGNIKQPKTLTPCPSPMRSHVHGHMINDIITSIIMGLTWNCYIS